MVILLAETRLHCREAKDDPDRHGQPFYNMFILNYLMPGSNDRDME